LLALQLDVYAYRESSPFKYFFPNDDSSNHERNSEESFTIKVCVPPPPALGAGCLDELTLCCVCVMQRTDPEYVAGLHVICIYVPARSGASSNAFDVIALKQCTSTIR
jgi:hypothetical protein